MHLMMQHNEPGDWVVSTMETHSVREMCEVVFGHLGLVYAKNVIDEKQKFKKIFFYFGLTSILIIVSITMNMLRNA